MVLAQHRSAACATCCMRNLLHPAGALRLATTTTSTGTRSLSNSWLASAPNSPIYSRRSHLSVSTSQPWTPHPLRSRRVLRPKMQWKMSFSFHCRKRVSVGVYFCTSGLRIQCSYTLYQTPSGSAARSWNGLHLKRTFPIATFHLAGETHAPRRHYAPRLLLHSTSTVSSFICLPHSARLLECELRRFAVGFGFGNRANVKSCTL